MLADSNLHREKQLFQLICQGNEAAFAEFYLAVKSDTGAYTHRVLQSREAAQEVIQESLIRLWLYRDKLVEVTNPRAWFFRIVANECVRYLEKHGFKSYDQQAAIAVTDANQTEQSVFYRETQRIIATVVASLPPKRRNIYLLSREEGLTQPEIAKRLGVSRDYVKQALTASLQAIRQRLIDEGIFLPVILVALYKIFF